MLLANKKSFGFLQATLVAAFFLSYSDTQCQITLADFNPWDQINPNGGTELGAWSGFITQHSGFITVGLAEDTGGFYADIIGTTPIDLTMFVALMVSARLEAGNAATGFTIILVDDLGNDAASAFFPASAFSLSGFSYFTSTWTVIDAAALASVGGFFVYGSGLGNNFHVSFGELIAVPENSSGKLFFSVFLVTLLIRYWKQLCNLKLIT